MCLSQYLWSCLEMNAGFMFSSVWTILSASLVFGGVRAASLSKIKCLTPGMADDLPWTSHTVSGLWKCKFKKENAGELRLLYWECDTVLLHYLIMCSAADQRAVQMFIDVSQKIIGCPPLTLEYISNSQKRRKQWKTSCILGTLVWTFSLMAMFSFK